ncbi:hypothetical protein MNV49_001951 [Pseudohyphozyma bogoriensis]|nr:hypothetical protein MNV49_001951 [Pseudohyphozyma bogoriensis]
MSSTPGYTKDTPDAVSTTAPPASAPTPSTVITPASPVEPSSSTTPSTSSSRAATPPPAASWSTHYSTLVSKLPATVSSRLPSAQQAETHVGALQSRFAETGRAAKVNWDKVKDNPAWKQAGEKMDPERLCTQAWSVTNCTQIPVNLSLNQVGPLMYQVLFPNDTFERRVPNVWFDLSLRPYTSPATAHTSLSVALPIIAVTGPVVAATSLLLVPFAALAVGGTALASLTGFGAAVAEGAGAVVAAGGSAVGTAAGVVAKAAHLPGGNKVKGKLVEAGEKAFGGPLTAMGVGQRVVKYLKKGGAAAGAGVAAVEEERGRKKGREEKRESFAEVEVTGLELEKVLKAETGKKRVDKALKLAFKKLEVRIKEFKTKTNPVLNIRGGPEIQARGQHQYLVFYPFVVERVAGVEVEPLGPSEAPPTEQERDLLENARIVETTEEAVEVMEKVEGEALGDEKGSSSEEAKGDAKGKGKGKETEKKKGWLW